VITLKAYFDDAGTHASSEIVGVGGLIGTIDQWEVLERQWNAKLAAPLEEKPPLNKFHLVDCNARKGEFIGYNYAEQDLVIHDFRKIIIDTKLIGFAAMVDRKSWKELGADSIARDIAYCVDKSVQETIQIAGAHQHGDAVAITFDQGMWAPDLAALTARYTYALGRPRIMSVRATPVTGCPQLQAADIVATENYWHAVDWLKLECRAQPRAHFKHYLGNMIHQGVILDGLGIAALVSEVGGQASPKT
jgi:hypothetical protein